MRDDTKLNMNVNMTGKEYMEYRKNRSFFNKPLKKSTKRALPYFAFSIIGILFLLLFMPKEEVEHKTPEEKAIKIMPTVIKMSWNDIGKVIAVVAAPFLVIIIGLAWLIHGFGFLIFKG